MVKIKVSELEIKNLDDTYKDSIYVRTNKSKSFSKVFSQQIVWQRELVQPKLRYCFNIMAEENPIKKTLRNRFSIHLDCDFFRYLLYHFWIQKVLFVQLKLNALAKVFLCTGDTAAIYKLQNISLKYILWCKLRISVEWYKESLYTRIAPSHYQSLSKKDIYWEFNLQRLFLFLIIQIKTRNYTTTPFPKF